MHINQVYLHGGCTYYDKSIGPEGKDKFINIGCDFQHAWDMDTTYDLEMVRKEVFKSIDSFIELFPEYSQDTILQDESDGMSKII